MDKKVKRPIINRLKTVLKKDIRTIKKATNESPVNLYDHIAGDKFSHKHKIRVGVVVMVAGVAMSKVGHFVPHSLVLILVADLVGYFFHGYGSVALIEFFHHKSELRKKRKEQKDEEKN